MDAILFASLFGGATSLLAGSACCLYKGHTWSIFKAGVLAGGLTFPVSLLLGLFLNRRFNMFFGDPRAQGGDRHTWNCYLITLAGFLLFSKESWQVRLISNIAAATVPVFLRFRG